MIRQEENKDITALFLTGLSGYALEKTGYEPYDIKFV
jgi:hypothetical protein